MGTCTEFHETTTKTDSTELAYYGYNAGSTSTLRHVNLVYGAWLNWCCFHDIATQLESLEWSTAGCNEWVAKLIPATKRVRRV